MKPPRYREDLFKTIFRWIGIGFLAFGSLGLIGILKPAGYAGTQDANGMVIGFFAFGAVFLIWQSVLAAIAARKKKLHNELLANGTKVNGTVEKVCVEMGVRYAGKTPYIILYTYTHQGKDCHGESYFLWERPDVAEHDSIAVYANDSGKSTIQL